MKNAFKEFARLNGNELKNFFDNTVIVFDTNVLLCLYSFTSKTRRRLLDMMEDYSSVSSAASSFAGASRRAFIEKETRRFSKSMSVILTSTS